MKTTLTSLFLFISTFCFSYETKELFVPVDGAELFCKVMGEGEPIIVIHGGPGLRHDYLTPSLQKLAEKHLIIFYDQRASGLSSGEINASTMHPDVFVNDIEVIRSYFEIEKVTLLGHSWGAFLALQYALNYPDTLDKLIIISAPPLDLSSGVITGVNRSKRAKLFSAKRKALEATEGYLRKDPEVMQEYMELYCAQHFYDISKARKYAYLLDLAKTKEKINMNHALALHAESYSHNMYPHLKNLYFPTLILHGDFDPIPVECAEKLNESLPNSSYTLFEKCGHALPLEFPDETVYEIENFLGEN